MAPSSHPAPSRRADPSRSAAPSPPTGASTQHLARPASPLARPASPLARPAVLLGLAATLAACDILDADEDARRRIVEDSDPALAVEWSGLAYEIAWAEDRFLTFKGQRAIAMMHLAMHDALQAVVPVYEPYAHDAEAPGADPVAAATEAAYRVLLASYPDRRATLDSARAVGLERAAGDGARTAGLELGAAAATTLLDLRAGDGADRPGSYTFRTEPGQYRTTPPWDGFTLLPAFGSATPLSFDDPTRFRPAAPPALGSDAYAAALAEVREQGDSSSSARTPEQTGYAVWWMEFAESAVGRLARRELEDGGLDLWAANRALAHLYVALFDGYVASWDSKYHYNHWRPYTAVRRADADGNEATAPDPDWVPLRPTPPFPEYASAHATGCGAAYEVMAEVLGDVAFENTSLTAPPGMPTRSFPTFRAAAEECADSRVRLGWHFRYATDAGLDMGRRVARHVLTTTLLPR